MHTGPMKDSDGTFGPEVEIYARCPKCGDTDAVYQTWESKDGAYEDERYRCTAPGCGHVWWVEGPDA